MPKIRFFKIIVGILFCTIFALFYTHQEIESVKMSFLIDTNQHKVSFLLDQYKSLLYNLSRLQSPKRIEETLCVNEITLCLPKTENIQRFSRIDLAYTDEKEEETIERPFLANIFDRFSTKAEAKVVK